MGKFDGILIASDWDGTLYFNGQISDENIKAVRYFQKNGGIFTICSGRYLDFLKQFKNKILPNTYTLCYNGALTVDLESNDKLYEGFCDEYLFEIIDKLLKLPVHYTSINIYDDVNSAPTEFSVEEYFTRLEDIKTKRIYKVLFRTDTAENGAIGAEMANTLDLRGYIAVRSWEISLEIMKKENAKGAALHRLADAIGAKLTVGIGDFENDIELIKEADIGYAVENACEKLKAVADRITVHARNSAVAKVIHDLECEINSKKQA